MNFGEFQNGKAQQPLPPALAPHEAEINHFTDRCNQACNRILKLLALGLGVCIILCLLLPLPSITHIDILSTT